MNTTPGKTLNAEYDLLFKILLIGNRGCGKSCMLIRYAENAFRNNYLTSIGVDFVYYINLDI